MYGSAENLKFRQRYQFVKGVKKCSLKYLMVQKFYYTPYDNFGEIYWDNGEIAHYVKYLAICVYPNKNNEFYLFCCDEQYDVVGDSLWDSIEMCMAVANTSHGGQIIWIKNEV